MSAPAAYRWRRPTTLRGMTDDERDLLAHLGMWGSAGYPVRKSGCGWTWGPWRSIQGPPSVFKTKREATQAFEAYYDILLDANAGRI